MNARQKIFLTIVICEVWGLTTLALLLFGSLTGRNGNQYVVLTNYFMTFICTISCCFTMRIEEELFNNIVPAVSEVPIAFFIQFIVYAIIGLVISIFVCRKTNTEKQKMLNE